MDSTSALSEASAGRVGRSERRTGETDIAASIGLDGTGQSSISTGIGFLDHMIDQLARHGRFDIDLTAKGDLHVDFHHTTEDSGIVLGQAFAEALGEGRGIERFADACAAMDESLSRVAIDISGRPYLDWKVDFTRDKLGEMDTELFREFFHAFAQAAGITLHVENFYGENNHHKIESCFKAFAVAMRQAVRVDERFADRVPSTKGVLSLAGASETNP
ncbi:MAG: imidazoleglycerol-phosphate dehydratase HisB [Pseudomonadota bacterium]